MKVQVSKKQPLSGASQAVIQNFPGYFLLACLIFSLIACYFLLRPFLLVLIFAAILATAFHSFYLKVLALVRGHSGFASFLTCLIIFLVIILPLVVFVLFLGKQAFDTYILILQKVQSGSFNSYFYWQKGNIAYDFYILLQQQLGGVVDFSKIDIKNDFVTFAKNVSSFLVQESATFVKGVGSLVIGFFLLFFALYYFLKDASSITEKLSSVSPLPARYNLELFRKFKEITRTTLYGIFFTAMAQGFLGAIGFMIVGIPNALFWGTAIAFFSLIPLVGTAFVWFPAAVILFASGNVVGGVILLLWGVLVIGTVDNFLRVFLIGNQIKMNPLFAFMSVFGGLGLFGLPGVIFGPLILTLFFTFLHIYELEYRPLLGKATLVVHDKISTQIPQKNQPF